MAAESAYSWESDEDSPGAPAGAHIDVAEAEQEFANLLIQLKTAGTLSATQACLLAHWASRAGCNGLASKLAFEPGRQSGAYSRHWDRVVGVSVHKDRFLKIGMPFARRADAMRVVEDMPVVPPHEALHAEVAAAEDFMGKFWSKRSEPLFPPCYFANAVVREAPADVPVVPMVIYVDGISFSRTDSVIAWYCYSCVTCRRTLMAVLRRSELCDCGCRGWCSIFKIWQMLRWSFDALRAGVWPLFDQEGRRMTGRGGDMASQPLGFRGCLLFCKADWSELVHTFGFASWGTQGHPCPFCACSSENWLAEPWAFDAMSWRFDAKDFPRYDVACRSCEFLKTIPTASALRQVRASLSYDRRRAGCRGRGLDCDLPELGLLKGDRVEPSPAMPDVCGGHDICDAPVTLTFVAQGE